MSEAKGGKIATVISVLALLVSFAALRLQFKEREDRIADRAEVLDYEIGSERVDPKQYDDYIKIYNLSRGEVHPGIRGAAGGHGRRNLQTGGPLRTAEAGGSGSGAIQGIPVSSEQLDTKRRPSAEVPRLPDLHRVIDG
jgi:hypothetical protein